MTIRTPLPALLTRARERLTRVGDPHDEDLIAQLADAAERMSALVEAALDCRNREPWCIAGEGNECGNCDACRFQAACDAYLRALDGKDGASRG